MFVQKTYAVYVVYVSEQVRGACRCRIAFGARACLGPRAWADVAAHEPASGQAHALVSRADVDDVEDLFAARRHSGRGGWWRPLARLSVPRA